MHPLRGRGAVRAGEEPCLGADRLDGTDRDLESPADEACGGDERAHAAGVGRADLLPTGSAKTALMTRFFIPFLGLFWIN